MTPFFLAFLAALIAATIFPGLLVISQGVIFTLARLAMELSLWLSDVHGAIENGKQSYQLRRRARVNA